MSGVREADIDVMRDVYMTNSQRLAYDRIVASALATAMPESGESALPTLPKPFHVEYDDVDKVDVPCYSPTQMRSYARLAMSASPPAKPADGDELAEQFQKGWKAAMTLRDSLCNAGKPAADDMRAALGWKSVEHFKSAINAAGADFMPSDDSILIGLKAALSAPTAPALVVDHG